MKPVSAEIYENADPSILTFNVKTSDQYIKRAYKQVYSHATFSQTVQFVKDTCELLSTDDKQWRV